MSKIKSALHKLQMMLFHNWGLKLISVLLAVAIWFIVVQVNNPTDTRSYSNIHVTWVNADVLDAQNKVYEVLDNTDVVRVTVRAPRSVLENLSEADIVAEADMSKLTDINTVAIRCYTTTDDTVYSATPNIEYVTLNVEDKSSKYVRLTSNVKGEVAEGYKYNNVSLDQNMIEISGPASAVRQVSKAGVEVDVTDATGNMTANMEILLYDAEGKVLNLSNITKQTDYVRVSVEILATKEVELFASVTGKPNAEYKNTGEVLISPETVTLAGAPARLANYSRLTISDPIDITGATSDVTVTVNLNDYLPDNMLFADDDFDGLVTVTVPVEPLEYRSFSISQSALTFKNVPDNVSVSTGGGNVSVMIGGLAMKLDELTSDQIAGMIDVGSWMLEEGLTELEEGAYDMPIEFTLPGGLIAADHVTIRVYVMEVSEE